MGATISPANINQRKGFLMANAILDNSAFPLSLETVMQSYEQDFEYNLDFSKMKTPDLVRYVLEVDAVFDTECVQLLRTVIDRLEGGVA